ncbi:major facilitator superfamily domain-containing protein [Mrakia frigida]|uniref:major facilitator superfamily domain-containing protein n=1 Tax=Mrakia frigida TaxID=29902 RepID=UPI003FCBF62C
MSTTNPGPPDPERQSFDNPSSHNPSSPSPSSQAHSQAPSSSSTRYAPRAHFSAVLEDPTPAPPARSRSSSPSISEGHAAFTPLTGSAVARAPPISSTSTLVDIEHSLVDNDPRQWSDRKKMIVLVMVSLGSLTPTLGAAIYNPAFDQLRTELNATDAELALSLSLFILFQGGWPIFWSSIAEIIGRKPVYLTSYSLFILGTVVASRANTMPVLIGMRMIQAFGSAAVMAIGAGTLADIYEPKERGTRMGFYYAVPLLGPSLGPLIGGALTSAFSWRSTFYFIAATGGVSLISFCFFPDTWRRERSLAYQTALKRSVAAALDNQATKEEKQRRKIEKGLRSGDATPMTETRVPSPDGETTPTATGGKTEVDIVVEDKKQTLGRRKWWIAGARKPVVEQEFKLSLRDVNPLRPALAVLKEPVNLLTVLASGILFGGQYVISFTAAVTFAAAPYNYGSLKVGLVLVSFGGGNILGSLLGGRYSDFMRAKLTKANGGITEPEMRLKSMFAAIPVMIGSFLGYAWTAQEKVHIAAPVVFLFFAGFSIMVIYASALAFMVDSNVGRSSAAVACNSFFRGLFAFVLSECALPIRDHIGDGGLYTLFSGLLTISSGVFVLLAYHGKEWRDPNHRFFSKDKSLESRTEAQEAIDSEEEREAKVPAPSVP